MIVYVQNHLILSLTLLLWKGGQGSVVGFSPGETVLDETSKFYRTNAGFALESIIIRGGTHVMSVETRSITCFPSPPPTIHLNLDIGYYSLISFVT